MTPNEAVAAATAALLAARATHTPAAAVGLPDATAAYAVQDGVAAALGWFADGAPRHWKSGGPSREAVATHAPLPPAGIGASGADLSTWHWQFRGIEAEVALRLGAPVTAAEAATLTLDQARARVDAMCVAIEIVDSRWREGRAAPVWDKLADLQSHGALVLGPWVPVDGAATLAAHDWSTQRCELRIGTQPARSFVGTHSMADPAWVLMAWLRHATRDGATLPAGTVVTTGTWCGLPIAQAGDTVEVNFDGIGQVQVRL